MCVCGVSASIALTLSTCVRMSLSLALTYIKVCQQPSRLGMYRGPSKERLASAPWLSIVSSGSRLLRC